MRRKIHEWMVGSDPYVLGLAGDAVLAVLTAAVITGGEWYQRARRGLGLSQHERHPADTDAHVAQQFPDRPRRARAGPAEGGVIRAKDDL